jgi:photosystem II stability/assembly factor-like uncharacterized protein
MAMGGTTMKMQLGALGLLAAAALLAATAAAAPTRAGVAATRAGGEGHSSGPAVPLAPLPDGNGAQAFAFDPHQPDVLYAASAHARGGVYVFKTTDNGQHWTSTEAQGAGWESDILSLTADPRHSGTLYAGTNTAVYKTTNGGRNWRPFKEGLFPTPHKTCSGPPGRPQCSKYPYFGTPGKTNWNRGNGWVLDLAVDPVHSNVVYSSAGGVRKSTDGGHTWKSVLGPQLKRISVTSYGRTWKNVLSPQSKWRSATRIAIAPTRPESIYAITHDRRGTGIYKSANAGQTWHRTGSPDSSLPLSCCGDSMDALAVDPGNPQTVYADVGNTVLRTTNGGANWKPMAQGLPANSVTSLAADPRRPGTVYASVHDTKGRYFQLPTGGIYQTTNGGQTWTEVWSGFGVDKVAVDPARPSTIYAAGGHLLRSTNGGHTWAISP